MNYSKVRKLLFSFLILLLMIHSGIAQSGKILHEIESLQRVGTVLYIAAHPDDENTRLLSYFSNSEKLNTVYLSLTRGDGGQNLIGPELRERLGLIRTHELLQARNIDGAHQFFSRANDFGYSKSPEETLEIWDEQKVLSDVVWAIRVHQPDIIINRFNHIHNGRTHGHHTASAQLSVKAFDLAGDSTAFPEQLKYVEVWQPKRLYFNTSWWFYGSQEKFAQADKGNMAEINVGQYYPLLGMSNNEISAASRSMHKCQGFGSATQRGDVYEYLEFVKGDRPKNKNNIFEGINLTWQRLHPAMDIDSLLESMVTHFDPSAPWQSVPDALTLRKHILQLDNKYWQTTQLAKVDRILLSSCGIFIRPSLQEATVNPGQEILLDLELINRSPTEVFVQEVSCANLSIDTILHVGLPNNQETHFQMRGMVSATTVTSPYWLVESSSMGMYTVKDQQMRGLPLGHNPLSLAFHLQIEDQIIEVHRPVSFVRVDPVKGELADPVRITPGVQIFFDEELWVFRPNETKKVHLNILAASQVDSGLLEIVAPEDWLIQYEYHPLSLYKGEKKSVDLNITAPGLPNNGQLSALLRTPSGTYNSGIVTIDYDHIPNEQIEIPCKSMMICADLKTSGGRIGYIEGAGDFVDEGLRQVGYSVDDVDISTISDEQLGQYDAIIVGIRAFNVSEALAENANKLFDYVKNGGNVIVQYNTSHRLKTESLAPYPLKLSRLRVTDELSKVTLLDPDHALFNYPNTIQESDFEGWVQERGLYFPQEWDPAFTPLLSMADPGEDSLEGGLLVATYGKGHYIYSPLSYFRQLPAGVSGGYRLLANMIALGKKERP